LRRPNRAAAADFFPPRPRLRGRAGELRALAARIDRAGVQHLALVGTGGSGKSLLAAALGHQLRPRFPGGVHWMRVGSWEASTLFEILARRLGTAGADRTRGTGPALSARGRTLVVLDNHESDRALARFLEALRPCPVVWVITARRCLLSGVEVFPVTAPLVTAGRSPFPAVAALTRLLRWNPLALDIADRLVATRALSLAALQRWLQGRGVERVAVRQNEDDVVEVRLLVDWAWPRLPPGARRMLAVLAHSEGDDVDAASLVRLAGADAAALRALRRWHLVQQPLEKRFTIHAVVRQAVVARTRFPPARMARHYLALLERDPRRVVLEQTHLFAAMDHAHRTSDLRQALRIERLLARLQSADDQTVAEIDRRATG
jgi:hypothetical protein